MAMEPFYGPGMQAGDAQGAPFANVFDQLQAQWAQTFAQPQQQQEMMPPEVLFRTGMAERPAMVVEPRISFMMGVPPAAPAQQTKEAAAQFEATPQTRQGGV